MMSVQSSPGRAHTPSKTPSSSGSHSSWDVSLRHLSASLSEICQSPSSSCGDIPGLKDDHTTLQSRRKRPTRRSLDETANRSRFTPPRSPDIHTEVSSRACFISAVGRMCRKVRIRHDESSRRLHEQLVSICGTRRRGSHGNLASLQEGKKLSTDKPQRPIIRRENVTRGLKFSQDIGERKVHELAVAVHPHTVDVLEVRDNKLHTIHSHPHTAVEQDKLMCLLEGGSLNIKHYPRKYLDMQYPECSTPSYVPIMQEDYEAGEWHMSLYIPASYGVGRVGVRTVDDKVSVCWKAGYRLTLDLPHNVVTRSVSGVITQDHVLVLEARLCEGRDRCSTL